MTAPRIPRTRPMYHCIKCGANFRDAESFLRHPVDCTDPRDVPPRVPWLILAVGFAFVIGCVFMVWIATLAPYPRRRSIARRFRSTNRS